MIEEIGVLEGKLNTTNAICGELNKNVEYIEPSTQEKIATPTTQEQIIIPDDGIFALSKVIVNAIPSEYIIPSGTLNISSNGNYDVKEKEYANVQIPGEWEEYGYNDNPQIVKDIQSKMESIIGNWDSSRTSANRLFSDDDDIYIFPNVDTSNITNMSYMFTKCDNIYEVQMFDTSKVTNMSRMFENCYSLKCVPNFNTNNVTDFSNMFINCDQHLENAPNFNTSNGTNFQGMFNGCKELKNVPVYNLTKARYIQNMYLNCENLTDESIENILTALININENYTGTKTLVYLGFKNNYYPATRIQALNNYQDFINAGWSIGY